MSLKTFSTMTVPMIALYKCLFIIKAHYTLVECLWSCNFYFGSFISKITYFSISMVCNKSMLLVLELSLCQLCNYVVKYNYSVVVMLLSLGYLVFHYIIYFCYSSLLTRLASTVYGSFLIQLVLWIITDYGLF